MIVLLFIILLLLLGRITLAAQMILPILIEI